MNRKTIAKVATWLLAGLLGLEGVYRFAMADSLAALFRGAQNVRPSDPLPALVWWYVAGGFLWLAAGTVYLLNPAHIRRWSVLLALPALIYGIHAYRQSSPLLLSWSGIFHGDLVALGAASAVGFCLLGALGLLQFVLDRGAV